MRVRALLQEFTPLKRHFDETSETKLKFKSRGRFFYPVGSTQNSSMLVNLCKAM